MGRLLDILWSPFSVYFSGNFFDGFGVPAGGTNRGGRVPPRPSVFQHSGLNQQYHNVFLMFSGLLDSGAGEREISSGNLPLSEGVSVEYSGETTGI